MLCYCTRELLYHLLSMGIILLLHRQRALKYVLMDADFLFFLFFSVVHGAIQSHLYCVTFIDQLIWVSEAFDLTHEYAYPALSTGITAIQLGNKEIFEYYRQFGQLQWVYVNRLNLIYYTPWVKNPDNILLPITSPNINRFSIILSLTDSAINFKQKVLFKYSTTPKICSYTTLWNMNVRKLATIWNIYCD